MSDTSIQEFLITFIDDLSKEHGFCAAGDLSDYRKEGKFNIDVLDANFGADCEGCIKHCVGVIMGTEEDLEEGE